MLNASLSTYGLEDGMKIFYPLIIVSISVMQISTSLAAEDKTIGKFLEVFDQSTQKAQGIYISHIGSMGEGMAWVNTELVHNKQSPAFCPPKQLNLTNGQYFQIFRDYVEKNNDIKNKLFNFRGLYLLMALKQTFPCK